MQVAAAQGRLDTANDALAKVDGDVAAAEQQLAEANGALSTARRFAQQPGPSPPMSTSPSSDSSTPCCGRVPIATWPRPRATSRRSSRPRPTNVDQVKIAKAERESARHALDATRSQAAAARDVVAQQVAEVKSARQAQDVVRQQVASKEAARLALVQKARSRRPRSRSRLPRCKPSPTRSPHCCAVCRRASRSPRQARASSLSRCRGRRSRRRSACGTTPSSKPTRCTPESTSGRRWEHPSRRRGRHRRVRRPPWRLRQLHDHRPRQLARHPLRSSERDRRGRWVRKSPRAR